MPISAAEMFGLDDLVVESKEWVEGAWHLSMRIQQPRLDSCPECGGRLLANGTRTVEHNDVLLHGSRAVLMTVRQRYRCVACGAGPSEPLPDAFDPDRMMTRRLVDAVSCESVRDTAAAVARRYGIDEKTVRQISAERPEPPDYEADVLVLGIDETKLAGNMRGILVDLEGGRLIDIVQSDHKADIVERLSRLRGLSATKFVCMDMRKSFRAIASESVPGAQAVVDRWHVMRLAGEAMDEVRKKCMRKVEGTGRSQHFFRCRRLLCTNPERLAGRRLAALESVLDEFLLVRAAHEHREAFRRLYACKDRTAAIAEHDRWLQETDKDLEKEFKPLANASRRWQAEIFSWYDCWDAARVATNAGTESMNSRIKKINAAGNGYAFGTLRRRALETLRGGINNETPQKAAA